MLKRTRFGLLRAFAQQYGALRLSASNFDFGHLGESARIANAIYILLGPKSRTHESISEALDWTIEMPTTRPNGSLLCVECIPVEAVGSNPASWVIRALPAGRDSAVFNSQNPLSLIDWWNETVVNVPEGGLSRLELLRVVRDRDGGAHLDQTISSPAYKAVMLRGAGFNYRPSADKPEQPVEHSTEAVVRQIAHEVVKALEAKAIAVQIELRQLIEAGATDLFAEV